MNGPKDENDLNPEDQDIWDSYVSDFSPTKNSQNNSQNNPTKKLDKKPKTKQEEENFRDLLEESNINPDDQSSELKTKNVSKPYNIQDKKQDKKSDDKAASFQLDRKTEEKLRKGKIKIDHKIDLHGMTQGEAFEALQTFIQMALAQKMRCLLVITGKGKSKSTSEDWITPAQGVLKTRVPEWLSTPPLNTHILRVIESAPQHGGSGAYYVYLRRKR